jgi:membrane protease YdiL (CAAX protease family)
MEIQKNEFDLRPSLHTDPTRLVRELWSLLGFYLLGFAAGFIAANLLLTFYLLARGQTADLSTAISNLANKDLLLATQGVYSLTNFVLASWLYLRLIEKRPLGTLNYNRQFPLYPAVMTLMLVISFIPFNTGIFYEWNAELDLPSQFDSLEKAMRDMEEQTGKLLQQMTHFDTPASFLLGLTVIAIIPAIGEELLFRGLLQTKLWQLTGNPHLAIWMAGAIFSFIHFQFFGFLPRWALGVVFGYLYLWSGSIAYPMLAHFVNNGFSVLMIYLYQQKLTDINLEGDQVSFPWYISLVSLLLTIVMLFNFRNYFASKGWK